MAAMVHRLRGSRSSEWLAISANGFGIAAGNDGSPWSLSAQTGRRWVRASVRVTPSDHTSPAGVKPSLEASGGSYALGFGCDTFGEPVRQRPSLDSFSCSPTTMMLAG